MIRQKIAFDTKDFYDIQKATDIKLKWYVKNNERVHVGTPIVRLILMGYELPQAYVINSEFDGICHILNSDTSPFDFPTEDSHILLTMKWILYILTNWINILIHLQMKQL